MEHYASAGCLRKCGYSTRREGGPNPSSKNPAFILTAPNTSFYCKRVQGNSATLTLFHSSKFTGSQMADITMDVSQSSLYLEVSDSLQDAQLRAQFATHLRNPGRKVSPEEIGLRMVHGPEGCYATAVLKVPIAKQNE